jgi:heptosyltransferase-3
MGERRLVIRPGAIGDCVVALPAIERLCAGASYSEVWAASANVPLIRFADRVRAISSTGLDLVGLPEREPPARTMALLGGFDRIVSWYAAARPEFREAVAGLPFEFLPALPGSRCGVHAADFYLRQAGGGPEPAIPRIACEPAARRDAVVIHPFSGSLRKNWPLERFRELAAKLRTPVEWCAGPEEELAGAVRIDDLYELARRLAGARAVIGNDSGVMHLAAAAGCAVVALFGPSDPAVWAPRGERVRVVATARPGSAMDGIPLAAVEGAVVSLGVA